MTHPDTLPAILAQYPGRLFDLKCLPFRERATLATELHLQLACCPGCGCYIGSDDCHPAEDAVEWEAYGECIGHEDDEDDDDEDEDEDTPPFPLHTERLSGDVYRDGVWQDDGGFPIPETTAPDCDRTCLSCQGGDHDVCGLGCHEDEDPAVLAEQADMAAEMEEILAGHAAGHHDTTPNAGCSRCTVAAIERTTR